MNRDLYYYFFLVFSFYIEFVQKYCFVGITRFADFKLYFYNLLMNKFYIIFDQLLAIRHKDSKNNLNRN